MSRLPIRWHPPPLRDSASMYNPNATGRPTIGNGVTWLANYVEGEKRGLKRNLCVIDDTPPGVEYPGDPRPRQSHTRNLVDVYIASYEGHQEAKELLGLSLTDISFSSYRQSCYEQIADQLLKAGIVKDIGYGCWVYFDAPRDGNLVLGELYPCPAEDLTINQYYVRVRYQLTNVFVTMCNVYLHNVPFMIDGDELVRIWLLDNCQFNRMAPLFAPRPPLQHGFVPAICDERSAMLHKSNGSDDCYDLVRWCKLWATPEERRARLLAMVLEPGKPWDFKNIVKDTDVLAMRDGTHRHMRRFHDAQKGYFFPKEDYVPGFGPFVYKNPLELKEGILAHNDFEGAQPRLSHAAGDPAEARKVELHELDKTDFHNGTQSEHLIVRYEKAHSQYDYWTLLTCGIPLYPGSMIDISAWVKSDQPLALVAAYRFVGIPKWSGCINGGMYRGNGEWAELRYPNIEEHVKPSAFPEGSSARLAGYDGSQLPELFHVSLNLRVGGDELIDVRVDFARVITRLPSELEAVLDDIEQLRVAHVRHETYWDIVRCVESLRDDLASPYPATRILAQASARMVLQTYKDLRRTLALAQMKEA